MDCCFTTQPPEGGCRGLLTAWRKILRFNTQPPEGGCVKVAILSTEGQGFNTQPPEGGCLNWLIETKPNGSFNTQPPEGGCLIGTVRFFFDFVFMFQHTATRRWLHLLNKQYQKNPTVSTHSHPKVAAHFSSSRSNSIPSFQHTATRRWLPPNA